MDTGPAEVSASTDAHDRPGRLRCGALALSFNGRVLVRRTCFTPAAIAVLAALQPIAPAQNPVLGHVLTDGAQAAQHLPRSVNIIHAPTPVPRTVVILRVDQVLNSATDTPRVRV